MLQSDIDLVNLPTPNMELLDRVIDRIEGDFDSWDQESWGDIRGSIYAAREPCGTTNCFAGHAVIEAGVLNMASVRVESGGYGVWTAVWTDKDGKVAESFSVPNRARQVLGLTEEEASELFFHFSGMHIDYNDEEVMDAYLALSKAERKREDLQWFKAKVEEIRYRSRRQEQAFNRIAAELITSVPELEEVLKPGYRCPESRQALRKALLDFKDQS